MLGGRRDEDRTSWSAIYSMPILPRLLLEACLVQSSHLDCSRLYFKSRNKHMLLPSGSEQHEVLLFGSIQEGILQARH